MPRFVPLLRAGARRAARGSHGEFFIGNNAAYLLCARGILESTVAVALPGKAGRAATTRNLATVLKLQALAKENG